MAQILYTVYYVEPIGRDNREQVFLH